jgi:hypothetical protein
MERFIPGLKAIREFFKDSGYPVTSAEIRELSDEDKKELGVLCAAALNES